MRHVLASLVLLLQLLGCRGDQNANDGREQIVVNVKITRDRTARVCPVVTGISALGLETATGHNLALQGASSSPGDRYEWSGEGGEFEAPDSTATLFQCGAPGIETLTFSASKDGCPASSASLEVECGEP